MAKQKKRKKKKPQLEPIDKKKYSAVFAALIIPLGLLFAPFGEKIYFSVLKAINGKDVLYAAPDFGFFLIVTAFLFICGFIIITLWYDGALRLRLSFEDYFSNKIPKAKKHIKSYLITLAVWFVLITSAFWLSTASCIIADSNAVIKHNLFKDDIVLCDYGNAESVNVSLEYRRHGKTGFYDLFIEVNTSTDSYDFDGEWFNQNYVNAEVFLSEFDSEIIKVDSSNYNEFHTRKTENREAVKRIFKQ